MRLFPYIGITGFMSKDEVAHILGHVPYNGYRQVMIGILASLKTMQGIQNKWPNRYPTVDKITNIFQPHPRALNLIHYNTKQTETLDRQLDVMTMLGGPHLHGFQLNIAWPPSALLAAYRKQYSKMIVVLQIGEHALALTGHSPHRVAEELALNYDGLVDAILIDPSGGYGKSLNPSKARDYLDAIREK